jgi:hypothetical protein
MVAPFEFRRNLRQKDVAEGRPVNSGTLGYNPEYKDFPTESWKDQFVARLTDSNKSPHTDFFGDDKRENVLGNVDLFDGRPNFSRPVDQNMSNAFLSKYLQSNLVNPDDKITQVTARAFVEQDPKAGLANRYPSEGIATT